MDARTDMVFYDGHCGFCHRWVRFLLHRDADGSRFVFATRSSRVFEERLSVEQRNNLPASIVVVTPEGRVMVRSDASLRMLARLGGGYGVLAQVLGFAPRPVRDLGYRIIANIRQYLASQPWDTCPMVSPELRKRFLE